MNFPGLDPAWSLIHHAGHAMRLIDTWSLEETRGALEHGEKVLVVATTALGDSILTLPLVQTLSERLGRERVSLLVKAPYVELYQDDPRLHRVFTVRGKFRWSSLEEKLDEDPHSIALIGNMTEPDLTPVLLALWCARLPALPFALDALSALDGEYGPTAPAGRGGLREPGMRSRTISPWPPHLGSSHPRICFPSRIWLLLRKRGKIAC